jgi:hypothetical protein
LYSGSWARSRPRILRAVAITALHLIAAKDTFIAAIEHSLRVMFVMGSNLDPESQSLPIPCGHVL